MNEMPAISSGIFVRLALGLIGGGSIFATPLLLHAGGFSPHVAIGTGALAVSANAFVNFGGHARAGNMRWAEAALFAATGVVGALTGLTTGMPMINAIGTSLFAAGAFGLATALNYAASGFVGWIVAAEFIGGGVIGGYLGMKAACHLAVQRGTLSRLFAGLVFIVAFYIIWRSVVST